MSSYNDYDGIPITGSADFLIGKLRREWGFKGYVVSDSAGGRIPAARNAKWPADRKESTCRQSVEAGLNVRTELYRHPEDFVLPVA